MKQAIENQYYFIYNNNTTSVKLRYSYSANVNTNKNIFSAATIEECKAEAVMLGITLIVDFESDEEAQQKRDKEYGTANEQIEEMVDCIDKAGSPVRDAFSDFLEKRLRIKRKHPKHNKNK